MHNGGHDKVLPVAPDGTHLTRVWWSEEGLYPLENVCPCVEVCPASLSAPGLTSHHLGAAQAKQVVGQPCAKACPWSCLSRQLGIRNKARRRLRWSFCQPTCCLSLPPSFTSLPGSWGCTINDRPPEYGNDCREAALCAPLGLCHAHFCLPWLFLLHLAVRCPAPTRRPPHTMGEALVLKSPRSGGLAQLSFCP